MKYLLLSVLVLNFSGIVLSMQIPFYREKVLYLESPENSKLENIEEKSDFAQKFDTAIVDIVMNSCPQHLKNLIEMYEEKEHYSTLLPKLILLVGSPSLSRTIYAQEIAQKSNLPYKTVKCEMEGDYPTTLFAVFDPMLKSNQQQAIIIDGLNFWKKRNEQLCDYFDSLEDKKHLVIVTTNEPEVMSERLKLRFACSAYGISSPNYESRKQIAQYYLNNHNINYDPKFLNIIAKKTQNMDKHIKEICKQIVLNTYSRSLNDKSTLSITKKDVNEALNSIRKNLELAGYIQSSHFDSLKEIALQSASYIVPVLGLVIGAVSLYKQGQYNDRSIDIATQNINVDLQYIEDAQEIQNELEPYRFNSETNSTSLPKKFSCIIQ